jgi:hypothetical protein
MKTISLQQIRETLLRYTYDERTAAGRERSDGASPAPAAWPDGDGQAAQQREGRTARLKSVVRRIPILSPVLITAYRLIKTPGRIALIVRRLENVFDLLASVSEQHSFLTSRIQVLEDIVAEANKAIQLLRIQSDNAFLTSNQAIKMNGEGAEAVILRGMRHIIDSNHEITIFIKFAPQHLVRANVDPRSFLAEIRSGGFDILQVMEPTGDLRAIADEELCESFSVNLMLRKTKAE